MTPSGMNDMGADAGAEAAPAPAPAGQIMLSADMFPEGVTPKAGDKLVLGEPDESGNIPATLEAVPDAKKDSTGREEWENDFRKSMSPAEPAEEAQ